MRIRLALCCLLAAAPAWTATPSYLSDTLTTIDATKWSTTGAIIATRSGLTAPDAAGGSIIARTVAPDGSADGEIRIKLALGASGGAYTAFLRSSADAKAGGAAGGTYLAFEMQNPAFTPEGACRANFSVFQSVGGSVSLIAAFPHACRNGMEMRMAARGDTLLVWPDQETPLEFAIDRMPQRIAAGQPGAGLRGTPAGNAISEVRLASAGRTAPAVLDRQKLQVAAFPNHIDLQWAAPAAADASADLLGYWIYRDGQYLGRTPAPRFQDETVTAGASYTYSVQAVDQHLNFSPPTSVTAAAPAWWAPITPPIPGPTPVGPRLRALAAESNPTNGMAPGWDPRRVGVQATGAYWGGAGENIDLISGNLNFSVPLVTAKSRGGWSVTFRLSYNSQAWRRDANGEWLLGSDVGYGFGWKLLAGAVTPVWSSGQIAYYLFTDSTGAEYRLDQNNANVWTSVQGIYVAYNATNGRLQFPDGTVWVMGCQSSGGEADAGTMYPTTIQDSNGNYITIAYAWGSGASGPNSSARITGVFDGRPYISGMASFSFNYSGSRLASITNAIYTPEAYTFTHLAGQTLLSPFTGASFGTTSFLQSVGTTGLGIATSFSYNTSGEMTQMTTPLGGVLQWGYRGFQYGTGISVREVNSRYMPMYPAAWGFWHDDGTDAGQPYHTITQVHDQGTTGSKPWWFGTSPAGNLAVPVWRTERTPANNAEDAATGWSYAVDATGNFYVSSTTKYVSPLSPPSGWALLTWPRILTSQIVDIRGNLVQQQVYDYGASTPTRTYNFTYLSDANYTSRHIYNRLTAATVTDANGTKGLVSILYDQFAVGAQFNVPFHDTANYGTGLTHRGNVSTTRTADGETTINHWMTGVVRWTTSAGITVTNTTSSATGYSLPEVVTPGGNSNLATSFGYNSAWEVTSVTGANGANATTTYDTYGRPQKTKIPDGAETTYTYTYNPNTQTATLNGRWTKTTLDGFARPTKVETGHGGTTVSVAESEYAPCGCSPLGKVKRTARPHAPGATPQWTTYTYDGMGRTTAVTLPDGSVTTMAYIGNSVKTTDAAGKWKTHTTDAFENLTLVTEPNPAGGADWTTSYQYNLINKLKRVEMPRPYNGGTYTQVRTFNYNEAFVSGFISFTFLGTRMTSETNPETGTISYEYDSYGRMTARIDAKFQKREFIYDAYGRVVEKRYYTSHLEGAWRVWDERLLERVYFRYDTNPIDAAYSQNSWGRLAAVEFRNPNVYTDEQFSYQYSYNQAGRITSHRMRILPGANQQGQVIPVNLDASYAWDNEGRMTSLTGPSSGPVESYSYDSMGRLSTGGATYGPAGELLTFNGVNRTYNALG